MRISLKAPALLALLFLAVSLLVGPGAGAQEAEEGFDVSDLAGIQYGVSRVYSIDYSAMMEQAMATPGAELEMPTGILALSAVILEFDSEDNAGAGLEALRESASGDGEFTEGAEEVDLGLGDESTSWAGTEEVEGQAMDTVVTLVQEANLVYFVFASGSEMDVQETVTTFTNQLIENDGSGEGEFNEDGTSSGGLWDRFPAADDELVAGLVPFDQMVYPAPEGTPAA